MNSLAPPGNTGAAEKPAAGPLPPAQPSPVLEYDVAGFGRMLQHTGTELRWNLRAGRAEIRKPRDWGGYRWEPLTDRSEGDLRAVAARLLTVIQGSGNRRPWKPTGEAWRLMRDAYLHGREADAFIADWLDVLPPWDEVPRCEAILADAFALDHADPLVRWAGRYPFAAAVKRAYEPGALIRQFPVLIGPQGCGKSQYIRHLLPPEYPDWHGDQLELGARSKERAEAMAGRVIVEVAELVGVTKADLEHIKSFITRTDDGQHRAAYARNPEPHPRRTVFVGSANDTGNGVLPNDPSGNTRFAAITLGPADGPVEPRLAEAREQLWAEALHRYRSGEWADPQLPRGLFPAQAARNEQWRSADPLVEDAVAKLGPGHEGPLSELMAQAGVDAAHQRRFASALRNAGWTSARRRWKGSPNPARVWTHPVPGVPPTETV